MIKYIITPFENSVVKDLDLECRNQELHIKFSVDDIGTRRAALHSKNGFVCFSGIIVFDTEKGECISTLYLKNGFLHSYDGVPAESNNQVDRWFLDGLLHREDGPAVVYKNPVLGKYYYSLKGLEYTFEEYLKLIPEENAIVVTLKYEK